MTFLHAF